MRSSSVSLTALLVAAGLTGTSLAAVSITASDTLAWNGRAVPTTPSGFTWSWNTATPNTPVIDAAGRVYFVGRFTSTPAIGTIGTNAGPNAIFSATNSSDMALFNNNYDSADMGGGVLVGQQNSTNVFNLSGLSSTSLRTSGTRVAYGLGIQGTGVNNTTNTTTGVLQNNSVFQTGTFDDGISSVQQRAGAMILKDVSGADATGFQNVDFKSIGTQSLSFNSSGSMAWIGGVSAAAGSGGGVGQFLTTSPTAAPFGNSGFIALRDASGSVSVLAQAGEAVPGGGRYANGSSGVGVRGFDVRMNRNGQVYWDAQLLNAGTVSSTNDNRAFIHTPSTGTVQVYREGLAAPSSGGSLFTGGPAITFRSFSNAGLLFVGNLATGTGDVQTADAANNNSSGLYITDGAGATTLVARRNDVLPGFAASDNVRFGTFSSGRGMNNNGFVQFGNSLQGAGVTQNVNPTVSGGFPGVPAIITAPGVYGNNSAIFAGTAGNLQMIARQGQDAPGLPGFTLNPSVSVLELVMNNMNQMLFNTPTSTLRTGDVWGTVGQRLDVSAAGLSGPNVLYAWGADFGLVPMLYSGQSVEVDTGVFRTLQSWSISSTDNGDGGSLGLNDSGQFVARLSFVEGGWSLVTMQIPAPGAGVLALAGLSVLARRRRNA